MEKELQTQSAILNDNLDVFESDILMIPQKNIVKTILSMLVTSLKQLVPILEKIYKHSIILLEFLLQHRSHQLTRPIVNK